MADELIRWKRDVSHLEGMDTKRIEDSLWAILSDYHEHGPQDEHAREWIEAGFDLCSALRDRALTHKNAKMLQLANMFSGEIQACANQYSSVTAFLKQKSGLVAAAGAPDLHSIPPDAFKK